MIRLLPPPSSTKPICCLSNGPAPPGSRYRSRLHLSPYLSISLHFQLPQEHDVATALLTIFTVEYDGIRPAAIFLSFPNERERERVRPPSDAAREAAAVETAVAFLRDLSCLATHAPRATVGGMDGSPLLQGDEGTESRAAPASSVPFIYDMSIDERASFHFLIRLLRKKRFMPYISKFPFCFLLPYRMLDLDGRIA